MKFLTLALAGLFLFTIDQAAEAGRMGPHFGNHPPRGRCIRFRYSSICAPSHVHGPKEPPAPEIADCKLLSSTAPAAQTLEIKMTEDDKMLVEGGNIGIGYDHDKDASRHGREVYSSMRPEVTELPENIFITGFEEKPYNHKIITISFERFEQTFDCSYTW